MKLPLQMAQAAHHPFSPIQRTPFFLVLVILCILQILCLSPALADGCYMPEKAVQKTPEISAQRALLKWKDGEETLIIASALDSKSQKLGWIIPLPAVPSEIGKADPGGLKTLNFCIQPEITHDRGSAIFGSVVLLFNGVFLTACFLFRRKSFIGWLIVCFVLFFLLPCFAVPAVTGSLGVKPQISSSLKVEKTVQAGAYEIDVLSARNLDDLNGWLAGNGFSAFPPNAQKIVTHYIEQKWVFAAIKLTRDESGANTPHPVRFVFKANEAIYPMQLTALAGSTPQFELFVLGEQRAHSPLLATEFCDKYSRKTREYYGSSESGTYSYFSSAIFHQNIGHPDICSLMWDGCVLTKLSGTLNPAQMADDLRFRWSAFHSFQRHLYTQQGAKQSALALFVQIFGLFLIVSMIACREAIRQSNGFWGYLRTRLFPGFGFCLALSLGFFAVVPKLEANETHLTRGNLRFLGQRFANNLSKVLAEQIEENPAILRKTEYEIGKILSKPTPNFSSSFQTETGILNPIQGSDVTASSTPGNFTVEKRDGEVIIRVYDGIGIPILLKKYKVPTDSPEPVAPPLI